MIWNKLYHDHEIQKEENQETAVQQREGAAQGRPRARDRDLRQAGQSEAVARAQVEEGL